MQWGNKDNISLWNGVKLKFKVAKNENAKCLVPFHHWLWRTRKEKGEGKRGDGQKDCVRTGEGWLRRELMEVMRKMGARGDGQEEREEREFERGGWGTCRGERQRWQRRRRGSKEERGKEKERSEREAAGAVGYLLPIQPPTMPL